MDMKLHPRFDELYKQMNLFEKYELEEMSGVTHRMNLQSNSGCAFILHPFTGDNDNEQAIETELVSSLYKHFSNFIIDHAEKLRHFNVGDIHIMKPYLADEEMDINPVHLTLVDDYSDVNHISYLDDNRKVKAETNQHVEMFFNVLSENEEYKLTLFDFFNKVVLRGKEHTQVSQELLTSWFPGIDVLNGEIGMMKLEAHQKYTTSDRPDSVNAKIKREVKLIIISGDVMHGIHIHAKEIS